MKTFIQYLNAPQEELDACQLDELLAATPRRVRAVAKRRAWRAGANRGWKLKGEKEQIYSELESPKFKEKLNRIATKSRTGVIKMRPEIDWGDMHRAGLLPQQDYKPAKAEIKAQTHKTPQEPRRESATTTMNPYTQYLSERGMKQTLRGNNPKQIRDQIRKQTERFI